MCVKDLGLKLESAIRDKDLLHHYPRQSSHHTEKPRLKFE